MTIEHILQSIPLTPPSTFKPINAAYVLKEKPSKRKVLFGNIPLGVPALLVAQGGMGKGFCYADFALSLSSNTSIFNGAFEVESSGRTLIFSAEDAIEELHSRLHYVGETKFGSNFIGAHKKLHPLNIDKNQADKIELFCPKGNCCHLIDDAGETTLLAEDLLEYLRKEQGFSLIVIDTIRRVMPGDENDSKAASHIVAFLGKLAEVSGATVLGIHHMSKSGSYSGTPDQNAARGSSALTDGVRLQLNLNNVPSNLLSKHGIPKEQHKLYLELSVTKNNYGPPQTEMVVLKRGEHGVLTHFDLGNQNSDTFNQQLISVLAGLDVPTKKSEFITKYSGKNGKFNMSESALREAVNKAIEDKVIVYESINSNGSGRKAGVLKVHK